MSYLAKPDGQPHFELSDMRVMHNMFRREFALMPGLVGGVAAADHDRAHIIGDHMEAVVAILHGHHTHEDEDIWPLTHRSGRAAAAIYPRLRGCGDRARWPSQFPCDHR